MIVDDLGTEAFGVLEHPVHQLRSLHAVRVSGQLSTSVVVVSCPPCCSPVIRTGLRLALRSIYCRCVAGGSGTEND